MAGLSAAVWAIRTAVVLGLVTGLASPSAAHPLQFSYVDVSPAPDRTDVVVTVHAFDASHDLGLGSETDVFDPDFVAVHGARLAAMIVSRLTILADGLTAREQLDGIEVIPDQAAVVLRFRYQPVVRAGEVRIAGWLFPYDPLHQTFIKVFERGAVVYQDILSSGRTATTYVPGGTQRRGDVFVRFLRSGVEHIAVGPDHVLFLVGLLLVGGGLRPLVRIVTAFTLAHSVTLSLAVLNVVTPPARVVEPAIALSICYVGVDNLISRPGGRDRRAWIALVFGLVHGFGFASVLREIELPRRLLGWSLFAFNAGVEAGQLVVVLVVSTLLLWVRSRWPSTGRRIVIAGSLVVTWAGFYWLVERLFFA